MSWKTCLAFAYLAALAMAVCAGLVVAGKFLGIYNLGILVGILTAPVFMILSFIEVGAWWDRRKAARDRLQRRAG